MPILIADDDPISRQVLEAHLVAAGHVVRSVADGAAAIDALRGASYAAVMLDQRMPGLTGSETWARAADLDCRGAALAILLSGDADDLAGAERQGFAAAMLKPIDFDQLLRWLDGASPGAIAAPAIDDRAAVDLDDQAALLALGSTAAMHSMRRLLRDELRQWRVPLDVAGLIAQLHRLRAATRYCGTPALARAADRWERALREDAAAAPMARLESDFEAARQRLLRRWDEDPAAP